MNEDFRAKPTVPPRSLTCLFPDSTIGKTSNDGNLRSSTWAKTALTPKSFFAKNGLGENRSQKGSQGGRSEGKEAFAEVLQLLLAEDVTRPHVRVGSATMEAKVAAPQVAVAVDVQGGMPAIPRVLHLPELDHDRFGRLAAVRVPHAGLQMCEAMGLVVGQPDLERR